MPLLGENDSAPINGAAPLPLAIVGFAFEFPQNATSSDKFWQMLCEGRSASTVFPQDRMNIDTFYHPDKSRHSTVCFDSYGLCMSSH
jgi:acyl transferase domain-containing protein